MRHIQIGISDTNFAKRWYSARSFNFERQLYTKLKRISIPSVQIQNFTFQK